MLLLLAACAGAPADTGTAPLDPTLTNVQSQVFDLSCAFSSCHGGSYGSGGLDLSDGASYGALVGVPSSGSPSEILVVPGDSASSYVVKKCEPDTTVVGSIMPEGQTSGLDADRLDLLKAWIDAGAQDD